MSLIRKTYTNLCNTPRGQSDISEHLPTLNYFAKQCKTIAELGVREAISSYAFADARPEKYIGVDIQQTAGFTRFIQLCKEESINAVPIIQDSRLVQLENIDLLFIDTLHTYSQLIAELEKHNSCVNKFIILHDTVTYGFVDDPLNYGFNNSNLNKNNVGLIPALFDFLQNNKNWKHFKTYPNNNGLTVLVRR